MNYKHLDRFVFSVQPICLAFVTLFFGLFLAGCSPEQYANSDNGEVESVQTEQLPEAASTQTKLASVSDDAFRMAAYQGSIETVRQALDTGTNVDAVDPDQKLTAMHMAAYNGHAKIVQLLLQHDAMIDAKDQEGKTPLTHACTGPFQETVKILVEAGADVNAKESTEGFTPLMMAAGLGEIEIVRVLLENRADRTLRDDDDDRAIDHAKKSGHAEIVKLLSL